MANKKLNIKIVLISILISLLLTFFYQLIFGLIWGVLIFPVFMMIVTYHIPLILYFLIVPLLSFLVLKVGVFLPIKLIYHITYSIVENMNNTLGTLHKINIFNIILSAILIIWQLFLLYIISLNPFVISCLIAALFEFVIAIISLRTNRIQ